MSTLQSLMHEFERTYENTNQQHNASLLSLSNKAQDNTRSLGETVTKTSEQLGEQVHQISVQVQSTSTQFDSLLRENTDKVLKKKK